MKDVISKKAALASLVRLKTHEYNNEFFIKIGDALSTIQNLPGVNAYGDITLGDILDLLDDTRTSDETVTIWPDKFGGPVNSHFWESLEGRKVNNIGAEGQDKLSVWLEDEDDPEDDEGLDEWCTDCKEYDKERHNCPRFNRVIREALEEVKK